jgi:autotransporter-associated beta strand protein
MSQPTSASFTAYSSVDYTTIAAGPLALYSVNVDSILPTQLNEGYAEVGYKAAGYDRISTLSALENSLLGDIEPVVIGPGGQLYLLDGHHTFTALIDSVWGSQNPNVYVNVVANYSNLSTSQFFATMQANSYLLPLNNGVAETVNDATGSPIPTSLTGLTNNVYRGLEYSILKNQSSKLFAGAASTPGLDKMPGLYSDFLEAAAYQGANSGLGLAYLSPYDISTSTSWNLSATSATSLPGIGSVTAGQLPGFILTTNITVSSVISNATLGQSSSNTNTDPNGHYETGALADNGTSTGAFTGVTEINAGTVSNPILIGTANIGFIMQLGYDGKKTATLSNTANTYSGGTTILAGHLIVASDGSLGAAPTETLAQFNASLTFDAEGTPNNVTAAVQADNGIIFNSLSEGNGTLTLGTTTGGTFTTSRPIAVGNEVATLDVNGNTVTLNGPLITLPNDTVGLGNTASFPSLTIDDLSSGGTATATAGKVVLSTASPYFYGDIIIGNTGAPTVEVMNDAALGNTSTINGSSLPIGQIELNGGTLQTGASFTASERNIVLDGSSQIDLDGQTTTWGTLTDTKRSIEIGNSSGTAGAITFGSFNISQTSTLQLDGKAAGTTYTGTETVTFTNGVQQTAATDTLIITTTTATALGTTQKVFSGVGSSTLVHGIGPAWIVSDNGGGASGNAYNFVTYGSNGYVAATYTDTGSGSGSGISTATSRDIVDQNTTNSTTLTADAYAYALKVNDAAVITATGHTITLGDGTDPAGLIMDGGSAAITGGTLAFGGSEAIIYAKGTSTISAAITGTNGLVIAGTGTINLGAAASGLSGAVTIDSGTLNLTVANVFSSDTGGLLLDDVKSTPAPSTLNFTTNQTFTTLSSVGNNSSVTFSSGATLTIGDTTNNLSSTLSSGITETGTATTGALTFNGSGLFDLSGMSSGALTLVTNSTVVVNNSAQLRIASKIFSTTPTGVSVTLNGTSQLQFTQSGGGKFANNITGTGEVHLIGGTLQLTGTGNTYSGGTVVEIGSTLDLTTANVSTGNANITDAGGLIVFDQSTTGTYSGVISDGLEMGTGPSETGSLDKDDSSGSNTGNLILSSAQTYTGATYVETGTLTLGAANTVADSSGVTLGRVGGGGSAILALGANNQLSALSSNSGNFDQVQLNGHTLTLTPGSTVSSNFGGVIANGTGTGNVIVDAAGTVTLGGNNTYSGGTTVEAGTLSIGAANNIGTGTLTLDNGTTVDLTAGFTLTQAITVAGDPTFEVASGQTDTITGLISDGASPGIVELTGGGTLDLDNAANSYSGGTTIAGGSTLELGVAGAAGSGSITFSGTADTLKIDGTTMPSNTIAGFVSGDTFDISSLNYDGVGTANLLAGNVLEIFEPGHTYDLQLDPTQHFTGDYFHLASDGNGGTVVTEDTTPCYCRGTRIRTPGGDVPVEDLRIGDLVSIAGGPALPLKWVGRRSYSDWLAVGNDDIQPILFKAGSIADGVPARDLYVSPDHAMLMDGMLVPAHCLVNGVSIVKIAGMDRVEYFHLEFHRHVVIFAEGATAESFVDDDSRMLFHNADEYRRLYPCERRPAYAEFCAPRVDEGSELEALRRALSIRAGHPRPGGAASADVQSRPAVTAARLPQADHAAASQIAM